MGPLGSLHEAGDALVAVARLDDDGPIVLGSGVMVGPGLLLTATHVLDEFPRDRGPVFLTFLPEGARAWLPIESSASTKASAFDTNRTVVSDISLVSCTLNSDALISRALTLAPMQVALPLIGERLWAIGFRHQDIWNSAAHVTPLISSGLVTEAYPDGRGERLASPCFEINMNTIGGMSGGAVVNSDGNLVGILSSSFEGGPSYVTLVWEALRLRVRGAIPKLQRNKTISILGAQALRQVRLKGEVRRNPWGDLTLSLSSEETELMRRSLPKSAIQKREPGFTEDERDQFLEDFGEELELIGSEATIAALHRLSLPSMRDFLAGADIPEHCTASIKSFSVEDFEGVEDLELISTELQDDGRIMVEYFFDLRMLVWNVTVSRNAYVQHAKDFQEYFLNVYEGEGIASMEVIQRCYFKAVTVFDRESGVFSDIKITSSAIKPPRR